MCTCFEVRGFLAFSEKIQVSVLVLFGYSTSRSVCIFNVIRTIILYMWTRVNVPVQCNCISVSVCMYTVDTCICIPMTNALFFLYTMRGRPFIVVQPPGSTFSLQASPLHGSLVIIIFICVLVQYLHLVQVPTRPPSQPTSRTTKQELALHALGFMVAGSAFRPSGLLAPLGW